MYQKTYYIMEDSEFSKLVQENFNRPSYDVVAVENWANDSEYATDAFLEYWDEDDEEEVQNFINNPEYHCYWMRLLCALVNKGILPKGDYLITVCW